MFTFFMLIYSINLISRLDNLWKQLPLLGDAHDTMAPPKEIFEKESVVIYILFCSVKSLHLYYMYVFEYLIKKS